MYNHYEASEIVEVGKAEEMILGEKPDPFADTTSDPPTYMRPVFFAEYDE